MSNKQITEQEFISYIGKPLTRTRAEVREHFNLTHGEVKSLLKKYGRTEYTLTGARRNELMEQYLRENPGITYQELADKFRVNYKKTYRLVKSRNLGHLIREISYEERFEKTKQTWRDKYGVENPMQSNEVQEKVKMTNLERHGVEYIGQSTKVRNKIKETMLKRYSVENPMQNAEIQEKAKATNLRRYGAENPMQNKNIQKKAQSTHLNRYRVKNPFQLRWVRDKARKAMLERYGTTDLRKTPEAILKARKTLLNNEYRESRGWFTINEDNVKLLLDVDKFKKELSSYKEKPTVLQFIEEKELPARTVYNFIQTHDLYNYFELNNWGSSNAERVIYEYLIELGLTEDEIVKNDREVIKPYEIDLYIPRYNLGIEFNGTYWHSTLFSEDQRVHQRKAIQTADKGVKLYQIFEFDWNNEIKQNIIKSQLRNLLQRNHRKIYAKHCEIREVDYQTTKQFMDNNHMQGDGNLNKQINYGLYYKDELVYMMTFGKWRRGYKGIIDYEIFRSCSLLNTTVVGGASKLFKHFLGGHPNITIGTYSNLQTGDGNLYEMLGFKYSHTTKPTSFKVNRRGEVISLFSKEYQDSRDLEDQKEYYYELYNAGSKLWIYRNNEEELE